MILKDVTELNDAQSKSLNLTKRDHNTKKHQKEEKTIQRVTH